MALIQCKECSKEVSDTAEVCPNCGFRLKKATTVRTESPSSTSGCLVLIALVVVFILIVAFFDDPPNISAQPPPGCQADLECLRDRMQSLAIVDCASEIKRKAKGKIEWPEGQGYKAFPSFVWGNKEHSTVVLSGNKLLVQNGFGAWKPVTYMCEVDVYSKNVIGISVVE